MKLPYKSRNPNAGVLNYEITPTANFHHINQAIRYPDK